MFSTLILIAGFYLGRFYQRAKPRLTFNNGVQLRYYQSNGTTAVIQLYK